MKVLVESGEEGVYQGRSYADAPEIDGNCFLPPDFELYPGDSCYVEITDANEYDLYGEPVEIE